MTKKTSPTSSPYLFSKEAEQMILGCMLSSIESLSSAYEKEHLSTSDFYYPEHGEIFLALESLFKSTRTADTHLLIEELKRRDRLKAIGGVEYVFELASIAGTSAYFEAYTHDLKSLSQRRGFIKRCENLHKEALSADLDPAALATLASEQFADIAKKSTSSTSFKMTDISRGEGSDSSFLQELKKKIKNCSDDGKFHLPGLSTSYPSLDDILGGLREENFILFAARPSVGKTAFALNLVRNLGVLQKIPVAFFSLEMTRSQIFLRLLSAQSGVSASKIETGRVNESEMEQIETAIQQLEASNIFINDNCYNVAHIVSQMRKLADEHQVKAFFLDYIGLVEPIKSRDIKAYEIGDITRSFKNFANESKLPIICLAQLNRQADSTNRPQLSMLRDSGSLEQDADSVMFLHRRDLYDPHDKPNQIEVIVAKNRHGITNTKTFHFKKEIGVISEFIEKPIATWE
ncbi:MAG: Replicative DNA helicase [Chlamydiales bacterium]|nr:Replicative DNA helicase [Chlamydiales bacterium]